MSEREHRKKRRYTPANCYAPQNTWNKERVIAALKDWTAVHGRPPAVSEWTAKNTNGRLTVRSSNQVWAWEYPRWPSYGTVIRLFARWNTALETAGLPVHVRHPDTPLLERVQDTERLSRQGKPIKEIAEIIGVSTTTVRLYLNAKPCPSCGGPVISPHSFRCRECAIANLPTTSWTKEEILTRIHEWNIQHGQPPAADEWGGNPSKMGESQWIRESPHWPPTSAVQIVFGSWTAALVAAGLARQTRTWNPAAIIEAFQHHTTQHGKAPTVALSLGNTALPSQATVEKHFGRWNIALVKAGCKPAKRARWTEADALNALCDWKSQHGRYPSSTELETTGGWETPNRATLRRLFGSYCEAIYQAQQNQPSDR